MIARHVLLSAALTSIEVPPVGCASIAVPLVVVVQVVVARIGAACKSTKSASQIGGHEPEYAERLICRKVLRNQFPAEEPQACCAAAVSRQQQGGGFMTTQAWRNQVS